ncbi:MAG: hypothetical protein PHR28_09315 [candidate division Zixibacteria bacterium]|jgi:hypothetical protein|nr:hypothetical protein [candidate division Zixibacteria bacterium]
MTEKVFGNVKREPIFKPVPTQDEKPLIPLPEPEPVTETEDLREVVAAISQYLDTVHREITEIKQALGAIIQVVEQHGAQIGELSTDMTMTNGEIVRVSRYLGRQIGACEAAIGGIPAFIRHEVTQQAAGTALDQESGTDTDEQA